MNQPTKQVSESAIAILRDENDPTRQEVFILPTRDWTKVLSVLLDVFQPYARPGEFVLKIPLNKNMKHHIINQSINKRIIHSQLQWDSVKF